LIACVLIDHGVTQPLTWQFYAVVVLTVATGAMAEIMSSFYTVMGSVVVSVFVREMLWRVVLIAGIIALYFATGPVSLMELSLVFLLSYIAMLVAFSVKLGGWLGKVWHAARTITMDIPRRQFWSFFGLAILGLAIIHLDTMILGLAQQSTSLGAFFSAQRTTQVLLFFGQSIGLIAGPIVSKAYALGDHQEITRFSRRTILFAGAPTLVMAVAMAVLAGPIMGMFRPEFAQYSLMLQILLLSPVCLVLGGLHTIIPTYCGGEHVYLSWRTILMLIMIPVKIAAAVWGGPLQFAMVTVLDSLLITIMGLVISRVKCRVSAL
jgi:O-antigen/teichoic acid export membrane protein